MITVTVQNSHNYADLTFPCLDEEMQKKLEKLDRRDETNYILYLEKVTEPDELSVLRKRQQKKWRIWKKERGLVLG